jgi:hypothetical protein
MIQIQLQPEVEAQLAAEARARGMALEQYILEKLKIPQDPDSTRIEAAVEQIRRMRKGNKLEGITLRELISDGRRI